ncbi:hypothetical protein COU56_00770 [Candidatus Pacearchaeota archaeon CG10_big_fil_rev_8_21_14_0_10_31_9]|nr:MAG: hypothetical protein AUJ62_00285 [Candidatus Pacearchaeota archaeon CG1_02_32_21]PIN95686.1 MAG: hypothetical protein COU56_00770 [Candidatus Pacearchaeota archaeon CG10_big_fil_rev_8_21_14_0_10_31_9]PIZ83605.1 MAG: hypothetical protein COX97_00820 [Candidatus Pacearchaeota archaeon CG_4_10_14_0_2_um_filter_05_32_18]
MRIKLKRGKQKELIIKAKDGRTWNNLSKQLNLNSSYIRNELKTEKFYISEEAYDKLCTLSKENFDKCIIERLDDNWGKSKGGLNSSGSLRTIDKPKESKELAELIGIILGDGHVHSYIKDKKVRCYSIKIAGDSRDDKNYLLNYVSPLMFKLFKYQPKVVYAKEINEMFIVSYSRNLVEFFNEKGLKSGNKKFNRQTIPGWVLSNHNYLIPCLRGLFDTDGSVHYIAKNNRNIRISFTSYIPSLLEQVRFSLIKLRLKPSKIIKGNQIFISSKSDVEKYIKLINFSNEKHLKRYNFLLTRAPVV